MILPCLQIYKLNFVGNLYVWVCRARAMLWFKRSITMLICAVRSALLTPDGRLYDTHHNQRGRWRHWIEWDYSVVSWHSCLIPTYPLAIDLPHNYLSSVSSGSLSCLTNFPLLSCVLLVGAFDYVVVVANGASGATVSWESSLQESSSSFFYHECSQVSWYPSFSRNEAQVR